VPEIIPIPDEGLGNHSYLIELGDHRGLLLDPSRDPRPYLAAAEQRALTVAFSAETHLHADFISGSRELAFREPASWHRRPEDRSTLIVGSWTGKKSTSAV
jgi:hydroxyacylglutathione hydrolase